MMSSEDKGDNSQVPKNCGDEEKSLKKMKKVSAKSKGKEKNECDERRKKNFSPEERKVMAESIRKYDKYVHGKCKKSVSSSKRKAIMNGVVDRLNAIGHETRTVKETEKKWHDMKRRVREKLAKLKAHARGTGGGSPLHIHLTDSDEEIATVLHDDQVEGIQGVDSGEVEDSETTEREEVLTGPSTSERKTALPKSRAVVPLPLIESVNVPDSNEEEEIPRTSSAIFETCPPVALEVELFQETSEVVSVSPIEDVTVADVVFVVGDSIQGENQGELEGYFTSEDQYLNATSVASTKKQKKVKGAWEEAMLEEEQKQSGCIAKISRVVEDISQKLMPLMDDIRTSTATTTSKLDDIHAVFQQQVATLDEGREELGNLRDVKDALAQQSNILTTLAKAAEAQAEATMQLCAAMKNNTAAMRNDGQQMRRLIRRQGERQMVMQADIIGALHRVANSLESMPVSSESASRSTTPSVEGQVQGPQTAARSRTLRSTLGPSKARKKK